MYDIEPLLIRKKEEHERNIANLKEQAVYFANMHFRLKTLGLSREVPEFGDWEVQYGIAFEITRDDLPALYNAFGKPDITGKTVKDKTAGTIWVHICFPEQPYCGIFFKYERQLSEEAKCKIITEASYEDKLVCEV